MPGVKRGTMDDWATVLSRPDYTLAEKRALYEADCARRGMKPYDEVHRKGKE